MYVSDRILPLILNICPFLYRLTHKYCGPFLMFNPVTKGKKLYSLLLSGLVEKNALHDQTRYINYFEKLHFLR